MKKTITSLLSIMIIAAFSANAADFAINSHSGVEGDMITFTLSIDDAPNDVRALIMDITYNPSALTFVDHQRGTLSAQGYPMFLVNEYRPGVIRIGAIDPLEEGISQGDSGDFVHFTFKVTGDGDSTLGFGTMKDDLIGWQGSPGNFSRSDQADDESKEEDSSQAQKEAMDSSSEAEEDQLASFSENGGYSSTYNSSGDHGQTNDSSQADNPQTDVNMFPPAHLSSTGTNAPSTSRGMAINNSSQQKAGAGKLDAASSQPSAEKIQALKNFQSVNTGKVQGNRPFQGPQAMGRGQAPTYALQSSGQHIPTGMKAPYGHIRTNGYANRFYPGDNASLNKTVTLMAGAVLIISLVLVILLAACIFLLLLVYKKLKRLEKSGGILYCGPALSENIQQSEDS